MLYHINTISVCACMSVLRTGADQSSSQPLHLQSVPPLSHFRGAEESSLVYTGGRAAATQRLAPGQKKKKTFGSARLTSYHCFL